MLILIAFTSNTIETKNTPMLASVRIPARYKEYVKGLYGVRKT